MRSDEDDEVAADADCADVDAATSVVVVVVVVVSVVAAADGAIGMFLRAIAAFLSNIDESLRTLVPSPDGIGCGGVVGGCTRGAGVCVVEASLSGAVATATDR